MIDMEQIFPLLIVTTMMASTAALIPKAPPVVYQYTCPYCSAGFNTYNELVAHVMAEHPDERIPIEIGWS